MAAELIDKIVGPGFHEDALSIKDLTTTLKGLVDGMLEANATAKKAEGFAAQAGTIKELHTASSALVDAHGKLVTSTVSVSKTLAEAAALKERYNGSTKDVLQTSEKLIRLNQEEQKTIEAKAKAERAQADARLSQLKVQRAEQDQLAREEKAQNAERIKQAKEVRQAQSGPSAAIVSGRPVDGNNTDNAAVTSGAITTAEETAALKAQQEAMAELNVTQNQRAQLVTETAVATAAENAEDDIQIATINLYRQYVKELTAERNDLNLMTAQGTVRQAELNAEIDAYNVLIKQNVDAYQKQKINIGNYPTLTAELRAVKTEMEALVVAGQKDSAEFAALSARAQQLTVSMAEVSAATKATEAGVSGVGKTATKAFGMLRTLANILPGIGISGLLMLIIEPITNLISKFSIFATKVHDVSDALKQGEKDAAKQIVSLDHLYRATQNTELSLEGRKRAMNDLKDQFPAYFAGITQETFLNGGAKKSYDELRDAILATARAKAIEGKMTSIITDDLDKETQLREQLKKATDDEQKDRGKGYSLQRRSGPDKEVVNLDIDPKRADELRLQKKVIAQKELDDFKKAQKEKLDALGGALDQQDKIIASHPDLEPDKVKKVKDLTNAYRKLAEAIAEYGIKLRTPDKNDLDGWVKDIEMAADAGGLKVEIAATIKVKNDQLTKDIQAAQEETNRVLLGIEGGYQAGLYKSTKDYENARLQAVKDGADKQTQLRIDSLKNILSYLPVNGKEYADIQAQIDAADLARQQRHNETKLANEKTYNEQRKALIKDIGTAQKDLGQSAIDTTNSVIQSQMAAHADEYTKRIEQIDQLAQREIDFVNASGDNEDKKRVRIAAIEAKATADKEKQEIERRKIIRQSAIIERTAALLKLGIDTFQKVAAIQAQAAVLLSNPVTAALAPLALAQIPYVIGGGAIAAAGILAQKLPEYAEGTGEEFVTGKAITDEKGAEGYYESSGRFYMGSDNGANVKDFKVPTKVIPADIMGSLMEETMQLSKLYAVGIPHLIQQQQAGLNTERIEKGLGALKQAIDNKPVAQLNVTGMGMQHLTKSANQITQYVTSFSA